jgi:opacity protein-like surface antigen
MKKLFAILALAFGSVGAAHAFEVPSLHVLDGVVKAPYAGATLGHYNLSNVDGDTNGTSLGVFAGLKVTDSIGAEVGYTRFGGGIEPLKGTHDNGVLELVSAEVVGNVPVYRDFTAFVKGGVGYTHVGSDDGHAQKVVPVAALGTDYSLTPKVTLRAEVRYVHDFAGTDAHLVNTSVGALYKF